MRDRYYRLMDAADLPPQAVLVRIRGDNGALLASILGDAEDVDSPPDLVLFRAALLRLQHNLSAIFILLDDPAHWQADWGDLIDYRVTRRNGKPALRFAQPPASPQCNNDQPGQTLNLNSITSPSLTTYSLPSSRALPASLAGTSPPRVTKSS